MRCIASLLVLVLLNTLPCDAQPLFFEAAQTGSSIHSRIDLPTASDSYHYEHPVRQDHLRSLPIRLSYVSDRPDSQLPTTMRYVFGGTLAAVSVSSLVGGVGLGISTVNAFQSDARLTDALGIVTAILSVGAIGFSITSGVWSVRLFRGKAILRGPSR